jgi:hypothetical protein
MRSAPLAMGGAVVSAGRSVADGRDGFCGVGTILAMTFDETRSSRGNALGLGEAGGGRNWTGLLDGGGF